MQRRVSLFLIVLFATTVLVGKASAELPEKITISGQELQLNGSGARKKSFIQVYESGLYLAKPTQDAAAILDADEWMAVRVKITSNFVSRSSLVDSLKDSLKKSTGGKTDTIANETTAFINSLRDEVKKDDIYDFVYVPSKGLYILRNGAMKGSVAGLPFKKALFGIWISDTPVDKRLRQAMLTGGKTR